ncbi:MAG: hypothetical protein AAF789_06720, partial [Bacteroidota bacterium]
MKGKTKQYALLGLVLLIWGYVGWRFFALTNPVEEGIAPIKLEGNQKRNTENAYVFKLDYRDPFLKSVSQQRQSKNTDLPKIDKDINQRKIPIPPIKLVGVVSSDSRNVAILSIDGETFMVKEEDSIKDFMI